MIPRLATLLLLLVLSPGLAWADDPAALLAQAQKALAAEQHDAALKLLDRAIAADPKLTEAYRLRGRERLRAADAQGALGDFDRVIAQGPADKAARLWERGIACYYAGAYASGASQLAAYHRYDPRDVEAALWRYLCVARVDGPGAARRDLLPVAGDERVPMAELQRLYGGTGTPEQVLAAARAGKPAPEALGERLFRAHLYLGLYHEAAGDVKRADEHLTTAVTRHGQRHYMGHVARTHRKVRAAEQADIDTAMARWGSARWADREAASRDLAALALADGGELGYGDLAPRIVAALTRVQAADDVEVSARAAAFRKTWRDLVNDRVLAKALARTPHRTRLVLTRYDKLTNAGLAALARALPKLRRLDLAGRGLSDPGLAHLSALPRLEVLHLSHAGGFRRTPSFLGRGMRHLVGAKALRELWLFDVHVTDAGLAEIGKLSQLRRLWLSDTGPYVERDAGPRLGPGKVTFKGSSEITDAGVRHLGNLTGLRDLRLHQQPLLTSACLGILARMPHLHTLALHNWSKLTPDGLARVGAVKTLRDLRLWALADANDATALEGLAGLDALVRLDLGSAGHLGDAAARLIAKQHPALRRLDAANWDGLTDAGLEALSSLKHLERLRLYFCGKVTDAGLAKLQGVKTLRWIDLTNTKVTWKGVHALMAAVPGLVTANPKRWALVDNPTYLKWKAFKPGTQITLRYTTHKDDGTTRVVEYTTTLTALDASKATLRTSTVRFEGKLPGKPSVSTHDALARQPRRAASSDGQLKRRETEKLEIGGATFDCTLTVHERTVPMRHGRGYSTRTRRWESPGMPGGLVKREWLTDDKLSTVSEVVRVKIQR